MKNLLYRSIFRFSRISMTRANVSVRILKNLPVKAKAITATVLIVIIVFLLIFTKSNKTKNTAQEKKSKNFAAAVIGDNKKFKDTEYPKNIADTIIYIVKEDETVDNIADKFNIKRIDLTGLNWFQPNELRDGCELKKGKKLKVKVRCVHIVEEKENINDIAKNYHINKQLILAENEKNIKNIKAGDKLYILLP